MSNEADSSKQKGQSWILELKLTIPMQEEQNFNSQLREQLTDLLKGGFAPVVILLREFHYDKTGIVLPGLHFSAFSF